MKTKLVIAIGCLSVLLSCGAVAGSCGYTSDNYSCARDYSSGCTPPENPCSCVDPACGRNQCMSKAYCCDAFGNIGEAW